MSTIKIRFHHSFITLALLALTVINSQFSAVFAQGALTPPGVPAPTMKSLAQIEPRTAITNTASLMTIAQPGSYYLTGNLIVTTGDGIDINTNGVTLDLNGFTIRSTAASVTGTGISLASGLSDITINNGHIVGSVTNNGATYSGGGFGNGISFTAVQPRNVRVSGVSVSGCQYYGIYLGTGNSTVVDACTVQTVGSYGIEASSVTRSTANQCGYAAIAADIASDCYGYSYNGTALTAIMAMNCFGVSSSGNGIFASQNAQNCCGYTTSGSYGLYASIALNCYGVNTNYSGLSATLTAENCYGSGGGSGNGLTANNAINCYGVSTGSGTALSADNASNCYGYCYGSGTGLYAGFIGTGCYGQSVAGSRGLYAWIGNSCYGATNGVIAEQVAYKYNMP